jgi:sugar phosphate isomerase/epimerase
MAKITRRGLLAAGTFAASLAGAKKKQPEFDKPVGVQLYTVRSVLPKDPDGTLKAISEIGYKEVETGREEVDKLSPLFEKYGLKCYSVHLETPLITDEGPKPQGVTLESALDDLQKHGIQFVGCPYSGPQKDSEAYKRIADAMNRTGEEVQKRGMTFFYHNHAYEFGGEPGKRAWDYYLEYWNPKLVGFELDVYWLSVAGQDPAEQIRKYGSRVVQLHLKDKAFGTPVHHDQNMAPATFKEVGTGVVDFPAVLRAAEEVGVKHYYVEQDQTPGDPIASLRTSYNNLRSMRLK